MDRPEPFQTYEDATNPITCSPRIAALRAELAKRELDGFIVPHSDQHMGEYLPPCAERLAWLTAFTGSAGTAVVLKDKAAIFVDGRYTLQVRNQTDTSLFEPRDLVGEGPHGWISKNLPKGAKLGYDPWLHTQHGVVHLRGAAESAGGSLVAVESNPIDAVWDGRPSAPQALAKPHPLNLSGEQSQSKRMRLAEGLKKSGVQSAIITLADSVCWLLNIRGHDVPHTPFTLAFAILHDDGSAELFLDRAKCSPALIAHLGNAVKVRDPSEFTMFLDSMKAKTVLVDPASAACAIFERLTKAGAKIKQGPDPCQLPKACKNSLEIEGMRKAHIRDGAALAKFLCWFESNAANGELSEIQVAQTLEQYRRATGVLSDVSFDTISGAGSNGAIVHYRVTRSTNRKIHPGDMFLLDSGAQYPDGTTDVTRTIMVGHATAEMRDRFTRVLKGHIALATVRFPEGTIGMQLDAFARRPLWEAGLDYDHGTGHGVGSYLSVHEGPQNISKRPVLQPLMPGMVCSNEPGFYKAGAFGIRIENLVVVKEPEDIGGDRLVMGFETITLVPIDLNLIEPSLLTQSERAWLNAYHIRVRETISPLVDDETRNWLERATRPI